MGLVWKEVLRCRGIKIVDILNFRIVRDVPIVFWKYVCILLTSLYADYIIVSIVNRIVLSPCPWIIRKLERL